MVAATSPAVFAEHYEHHLIAVADNLRQGYFDEAMAAARALVEKYPGSRLGRLMYADLLTAKVSRLSAIGGSARAASPTDVNDLRNELLIRFKRLGYDAISGMAVLPQSLLQPAPSSDHVVFADLSQSRLFVYRNDNGRLRLIDDFYVSQGLNGAGKQREGDQKTPVGVYYTTGFIPGRTLPSRYGPGALPISYPNPMDQRHRRTGYGIWIHGTEPFLVNRAPKASDGCLSLNNEDFLRLRSTIARPQHTPVIIDDAPQWVSTSELSRRRENLLLTIESWRRDRESLDADAYLSNYDTERFSDGTRDFKEWSHHKRVDLANKERITVTVRDIELFGYPGETDVILANFEQTLVSRRFSSTIRKQQYWKLGTDGMWRIIFEGSSDTSPPPVMVEESEDPAASGDDPASS